MSKVYMTSEKYFASVSEAMNNTCMKSAKFSAPTREITSRIYMNSVCFVSEQEELS
ncbi:MAG: hypothetical protein IJU48_04580 [Synergistaceae bacterium]|nr:hypothetical protein [Synergistaceae bacterium]